MQRNIDKTLGTVFFTCGCTISLFNVNKSKKNNKFTCLVHNTPIETVRKYCLYCKSIIEYKTILQITKRDFCSNQCSKYYYNALKLFYEENPPERSIDCVFYKDCLIQKSKNFGETFDIGCDHCKEYKYDPDWLK